MTRLELIRRVAAETGLHNESDAEKQAIIDLINDAAGQLWDQTDLPNSLREEVFTIDTADPVPRLTLPYRVGELRGCRDWNSQITLHDMRPRYNNVPWPADNFYTFRVLYETPLARSIDNSIGLYMAPIPNFLGPLSVDIVGSTDTAQEYHASFDQNGEGTAEGILWTDICSITKSATTPIDVILYEGDDNTGAEMSRIGSYELRARYTVVELFENTYNNPAQPSVVATRPIEVLYKEPFRPLLEDTSSFQLDGFDHVITYNATKIYRIRGLGGSATEDQINAAKVHAIRADEVLKQKIASKIQGKELVIQFGNARGDMTNLQGLRARRYSA